MDQTPNSFSMVPNTTLNHVGDQSVDIYSSSGSTMRITLALTVTAAGGLLHPMFIFKVKSGGHVQQELKNFPGVLNKLKNLFGVKKFVSASNERQLSRDSPVLREYTEGAKQ